MILISLFISSIIISYFTLPFIHCMLVDGRLEKQNYRGDLIPLGMGMTLVPVLLFYFVILSIFSSSNISILLMFLGGILGMAFVGIIDDLLGSRDASGFKGHIGSLFRGKLTTGGFKALIGGMIGVLISLLISSDLINFMVNFLIIALMTNLINLLDLRPGRAIKSFSLIGVIFLLIGLSKESMEILGIVGGYSIAYLPLDLKSRAMMGDVGSNTLGITLGIAAALSFPTLVKAVLLMILIIFHAMAEKYSISRIIKANSLLNYLDELGR